MTARRWVPPVLFLFCLGLPSAVQADFFAGVAREPSIADRIQFGRAGDQDLDAILGNLDRIYSFPQDQGLPAYDAALVDLAAARGRVSLPGNPALHYRSDTGIGTLRVEIEAGVAADEKALVDLARALFAPGQEDLRLLLFPSSLATLRQSHPTVNLRRAPAFAFSLFSNHVELEFRTDDRGDLPSRVASAGAKVELAAESVDLAHEAFAAARDALAGRESWLAALRPSADAGVERLRKLVLAGLAGRASVERVRLRLGALRGHVQGALDRLKEARTSLQEWFQGGAASGPAAEIQKLKETIANLEQLGGSAEALAPMKQQLQGLMRGMASDQGSEKGTPKADAKPLLPLMKAMGGAEKNLQSAIKPLASAERQSAFAPALIAGLELDALVRVALAEDGVPATDLAAAAREVAARIDGLPAALEALGLDAAGVREMTKGPALKNVRAIAPLLASAFDDPAGARAKLETSVKPLLEPAAQELAALQVKVLEATALLDKAAGLVEPTAAMLAPLPDAYGALAEGMAAAARGPAFRIDPQYGIRAMRWSGAGEWARLASAPVLTRAKPQRAILLWSGPHSLFVRGTAQAGDFAVPRTLFGMRSDPFDASASGAGMLLLPADASTRKGEARPASALARVAAQSGAAQACDAAARAIPALEEIAKYAVFAEAASADALLAAAESTAAGPGAVAAATRAVEAADAAADAEATLRAAQLRFERMLAWAKAAEASADQAVAEPKALVALAAGKAALGFAARADKEAALLEYAARVAGREAARAERGRREARSNAGPMWVEEADARGPAPVPGLEYDPRDVAGAAALRDKFAADAAALGDDLARKLTALAAGAGDSSPVVHEARSALDAALARLASARAVLGAFAAQAEALTRRATERMAQANAVACDPQAAKGEEPPSAADWKKLSPTGLADLVKELQSAAGRAARASAQAAAAAAGLETGTRTLLIDSCAERKAAALLAPRKVLAAAIDAAEAAAKASGGLPAQAAVLAARAELHALEAPKVDPSGISCAEAAAARAQAIVAAATAEVADEEQARAFAVLQEVTGTQVAPAERNPDLEEIRRSAASGSPESLCARLKKAAETGAEDPVGRFARTRLDALVEDGALGLEEADETARVDGASDRARGRRQAARIEACK